MAKIIKSAETAPASQPEAETTTNVTNPTPTPQADTKPQDEKPASQPEAKQPKLNGFEQAIKTYLDDYASKDEVFAAKYNAGQKTIQGCAKYIMNEARKNFMLGGQVACMDDATGYGMAVHYFDEDTIQEFTGKVNAKAMTSEQVAKAAKSMTENPEKAAKAKQKTAERKAKQHPSAKPTTPAVAAVVDNISDIFAYAESDKTLELF